MLLRFHALIFLLFQSVHALSPCAWVLSGNEQKLRKILEKNPYTTHRGLDEYVRFLGTDFETRLGTLGPTHRILLMGESTVAYDLLRQKGEENMPETTVVFYRAKFLPPPERVGERIEIKTGELIEKRRDLRRNSYDLIVDFFDAYAYSHEPQKVIEKYLSLLKPGGTLVIQLGSNYAFNRVATPSGETSMENWMKPHLVALGYEFEIEYHLANIRKDRYREHRSIWIRKPSDQRIPNSNLFPHLTLVRMDHYLPPEKTFIETPSFQ